MAARHALRLSILALPLLVGRPPFAQDASAPIAGRPIVEIVDELRRAGVPFAYSTTVLPSALEVTTEPDARDPIELVRDILAPHGLTLRWVDGLYVVVRDAAPAAPRTGNMLVTLRDATTGAPLAAPEFADPSAGLSIERLDGGRLRLSGKPGRRYGITFAAPGFTSRRESVQLKVGDAELSIRLEPLAATPEEIVVTASRYEIVREQTSSASQIDRRTIEQQPDLGDDPLRSLQRLPGAAAGGVSARTHIRGGEDAETVIVLNGQRLLDPFHIRDYQGLFSAIDARAIDGIEVFTGAFPVRYGDSIGSLVLIDALETDEPRHTEIGVSLLESSVLSAGAIGDGTGEWLVSARRGNLDRLLEGRLGEPRYHDIFGELAVNFSPRTRVSVNALSAQDRVLLIAEDDPSEREQSMNDTQNDHLWVHWEQEWSSVLETSTTFSSSRFDSARLGSIDDPARMTASVDDRRRVAIDGLRQDWLWWSRGAHRLSFGFEYRRLAAEYAYVAAADYHGLHRTFAHLPRNIRRAATARPDGELFGLYFADRWKLSAATTAELGWRWDKQGYADTPNERQFSPRFSVLHRVADRTDLRIALGRYYQSQGIHELRMEDGGTQFFPAQRADQAVFGVQRKLGEHYSLRIEAYWRSLRQLRPRYENLYDPLAVVPELAPDRVLVAPEEALARGIELSIAYTGLAELSWWASYVLSRVEDRIAGVDVPRSWDQRHAVQLGVAWDRRRWDLGAALNAHSGWPTTGLAFTRTGSEPPVATLGERNALRLDSFLSLDLRASRSVPLRIGSLEVFFEISNATDRDNPCCIEFDLRDDGTGGLLLEQDTDSWLPRLATFGVRWEF